MIWLAAFAVLALVLGVYVFCTAPSRRSRALSLPRLFAHRGLHGAGVSENSLEAFARACAAGVGIELDVRLSADGSVVVFHDDTLARLCGRPERIDALTLAQLRAFSLPDGSGIPTLQEVLDLVAGRLRAYKGEYAVESFNPLAVRYFRRYAANVPRGQLVSLPDEYRGAVLRAGAGALSHLLANVLSRPDFVAYDQRMDGCFSLRMQRRLYRARLARWTVRSRSQLQAALVRGESVIFEAGLGNDPIDPADPLA